MRQQWRTREQAQTESGGPRPRARAATWTECSAAVCCPPQAPLAVPVAAPRPLFPFPSVSSDRPRKHAIVHVEAEQSQAEPLQLGGASHQLGRGSRAEQCQAEQSQAEPLEFFRASQQHGRGTCKGKCCSIAHAAAVFGFRWRRPNRVVRVSRRPRVFVDCHASARILPLLPCDFHAALAFAAHAVHGPRRARLSQS